MPEPEPLKGRRIAVTRAEQQLGAARRLFEQAGAQVFDLPALVIGPPDHWGPLDDALDELEDFHWLIVSSANGVEAVQARLKRRGRSLARRPASLKIAAVGRKTAAELEALGAPADFVPPAFVADSLIEHFPVSGWGLRLLLPRVQSGGRTLLAEAFAEAGARVVEVAAYESRCPTSLPAATLAALEARGLDAITFSSGKTVQHTASCSKPTSAPAGWSSSTAWPWSQSAPRPAAAAWRSWAESMARPAPTTWTAWWPPAATAWPDCASAGNSRRCRGARSDLYGLFLASLVGEVAALTPGPVQLEVNFEDSKGG